MATYTDYYTVDANLIGEEALGMRTDYLCDALGSITSITNAIPIIAGTYRAKPFGMLLNSTFDAEHPRYRWTGNTGSRTILITNALQYNRFRHYSPAIAGWTTSDAIWPLEAKYNYVRGNPITYVDPRGFGRQLIYDSLGEPTVKNPCGHISWVVWVLATGFDTTLTMFQDATALIHVELCTDNYGCLILKHEVTHQWEAAYFRYHNSQLQDIMDEFAHLKSYGSCSTGVVNLQGHMQVWENYEIKVPPWTPQLPMYVINPAPRSLGGVLHHLKLTWDCRYDPPRYSVEWQIGKKKGKYSRGGGKRICCLLPPM